MDGIQIFNRVINNNLINNSSFLSGRAGYLRTYSDIFRNIRRSERVRAELLRSENITVPPIMIISVTNDCNLDCRGCYACAQDRSRDDEMTTAEVDRIIAEGTAAGVSIVFIAGGEPLMKEGIMDIPRKYKDTLFVMFTNGMLINNELMDDFKRIKNLVPAFSLEGDEALTDQRRGRGVFRVIESIMKAMDGRKLMFGASVTLTSENYSAVMDPGYLKGLEAAGCRALFLIEYVPCEGDPEKCLTEVQKTDLLKKVRIIQEGYMMLPIALPGDEKKFGGCLAAGRGFLHVSSSGSLEACPFAPFSDTNLKDMHFTDALKSRMLGRIRDNHHLLEEGKGGCSLFENREWVEELMVSG